MSQRVERKKQYEQARARIERKRQRERFVEIAKEIAGDDDDGVIEFHDAYAAFKEEFPDTPISRISAGRALSDSGLFKVIGRKQNRREEWAEKGRDTVRIKYTGIGFKPRKSIKSPARKKPKRQGDANP